MNSQSTRRELLIGGGITLLATASNVQLSAARAIDVGMSDVEKANVKIFRDFQAIFDKPDLDIDKVMARYIAPNASIRWFDDEPTVIGPEAAAVAAKKGAGNNLRVKANILQLLARGPLVASSRVDTIKIPGQPDEVVKIAGVCIIKDGKFHEYCDYIVT